MTLILSLSFVACKSNNTTTTTVTVSPGSGAAIYADSIVTAQIIGITAQSTESPWMLEVVIELTSNGDVLPNPVAYSVGDIVTLVTDQDGGTFNVNDTVTVKITITGDVNTPGGIDLYIHNVAL